MADLILWCHALATLVAGTLALHLALAWRGGRGGGLLVGAVFVSGAWAAMAGLERAGVGVPRVAAGLDVGRHVLALALVLGLLGGRSRVPGVWWASVAAGGLALWRAVAIAVPHDRMLSQTLLALSVLGLSAVEQLWRNVPPASRWGIKPLCIGMAACFTVELYVHAEAALLGGGTPDAAALRAVVVVFCAPLMWLFAARHLQTNIVVALSPGLVFHTTALAACGAYLLLMAAAGFYVRDFGGRWGPALQAMLVFVGLMLLAVLASSGAVRARLRWFLARHCFRLRYDYRETWLGLTRALSAAQSAADVGERVLAALTAMVESSGGALWWADENGRLAPLAWQRCARPDALGAPADVALWDEVLDLDHESVSPWLEPVARVPGAWLIVPLNRHGLLKGVVMLCRPAIDIEVDWEVRDVLKTAAAQAASDIGHWQTFEALLAARRFEATSRMSTFVLHELKNRAAELSLLLANAARHGHKPQFQADMLHTLEHAAGRLGGLVELLSEAGQGAPPGPVCLVDLLQKIVAARLRPGTPLSLEVADACAVRANATRLERVIGHLVQNAMDATDGGGRVWVNLARAANSAVIEIHDTGVGMSEQFMRERLFKPFHTTKARGMGIGAYECQQYIQELGGRIEVESAPGAGTTMRVWLSLDAPGSAVEGVKVAA